MTPTQPTSKCHQHINRRLHFLYELDAQEKAVEMNLVITMVQSSPEVAVSKRQPSVHMDTHT